MSADAAQPPTAEGDAERARAVVELPRAPQRARRLGPVGDFFARLGRALVEDGIDNVGAMMAYYAILALFPMLVFVVTIAMLVVDPATIQQGVAIATEALPASTRALISARVDAFISSAGAGFAIGSAAFALWGASRGAVALSGALNQMFGKRETRPWLRRQLLAIVVTLSLAVVVVLALGLLVVGPLVGHRLAARLGIGGAFDVAWGWGRWGIAGLLVMVVWAVMYRLLPNTRAPFRVFTPGAIAGVLLWLGISYAFGVYLDHFGSYETTYGALGGAIIFLTWLWLSNVALLVGAEINDVLADMRRHRSAAARQLADPDEWRHSRAR